MSTQLFDRKIEVSIGESGKTGFLYRDLRIGFKVEKSLSDKPNKATVKIYNLAINNRSQVEKTNNAVVIKAGYGQEIDNIFSGDVSKAFTEQDKTDFITTIESGDGEIAYKTSVIEKSYSKGTDLKSVFSDLINQTGLQIGDISGVVNEKLLSGLSLSGSVRDQISILSERQNSEWSIQDGAVQIISKGTATKESAILISATTGMIGIPKKRFEKDTSGKDKELGIEVTSLLNGKIKPGRLIRVESKLISGDFKVQKVIHEGDNYAQEYYSKIEAVPL